MAADITADHEEIRRLVAEAFAGLEGADVVVEVVRARHSRLSFTGLAFWELPPTARRRLPSEVRYLVRLRLPSAIRNRSYPKTYRYRDRTTAPWITVEDWRERLVALAAHEACHVRQFREGLRRSEVEAERWALRVLDAWRSGSGGPEAARAAAPAPAVGLGDGWAVQLRLPLAAAVPASLT